MLALTTTSKGTVSISARQLLQSACNGGRSIVLSVSLHSSSQGIKGKNKRTQCHMRLEVTRQSNNVMLFTQSRHNKTSCKHIRTQLIKKLKNTHTKSNLYLLLKIKETVRYTVTL
ncbi:hypothetical protein ElyMa_002920900 [Elysia marginata]|uniref:Uncharacterized protein n=1 Tax=Elysia marginata TaxID=1093978 RepID=A0AAV4I308_9GAST|nr:hypothetical protein ElyMa_002920900 [Elysia marginata]